MKKAFGILLAVLVLLTSLWLPAPLGGVREAEAAGTYTYDPSLAADWAAKQENVDNTGGKCAYFVSKALEAGGIKDVSNTWAPTLVSNIKGKGYGTELAVNDTNLKKIKRGDVIAIYTSGVQHVMIVTSVGSNYVKISQRNKNRCNYKITFTTLKKYHTYWDGGTKTTFLSMNNTAKKVTVTFDPWYGTVDPASVTVTAGQAITLPTAICDGYTCVDWYDDDDEWIGEPGDSYIPSSNITLYSYWTAKSYIVYFDTNDGSGDPVASMTVTFGETYGEMPTSTWTGYDFDGWYTAPSGGSRIDSDTTVTTAADHTLYAHWSMALPTITTQPANATVNQGKTATFKVVATGADSYKWQYQKPGESTWNDVIYNGTSATYNLTTAARHNGYKYRCKVTNAAGSVYSSTVTLTVTPAVKPTITTQPKNASVGVGTLAAFQVKATNATKYQWQYQKPGTSTWTNVANNGTSATYSLTTAARHNGYKYRCKVTNAAGSVYSSTVTLTVTPAVKPTITTQPKNASVGVGTPAAFQVKASNATSYQWQYQKPGSSTWTDVSKNGTSATYTLTTAARHNGYKYRCKVTNSAGTVTSSVVTLTVK